MKNGVPFHSAFGMTKPRADTWQIDKVERRAMAITFSCLNGAEYDWEAMRFKEPPK
ncbi:hypothetical protein C7S13_3096 [Burkholderia cepacia]|nr:hypothetical protein [Burkholderia cepacia]